MDCAERALLFRRADGELDEAGRRRLDAHLANCPACREAAELLGREAALIAAALRGKPAAHPPARRRTLAVAAVAIPLLFVGLFALLRTYERAGARLAAASGPAAAALERSVKINARGTPLTEVLRTLSEDAGVPIELASGALDAEPAVDIQLVAPIQLRHLLGLLTRFYGLRVRVERDAIRLEGRRES
jgi:anti-sigma factor RsiW